MRIDNFYLLRNGELLCRNVSCIDWLQEGAVGIDITYVGKLNKKYQKKFGIKNNVIIGWVKGLPASLILKIL